jgi:hypothetical protein
MTGCKSEVVLWKLASKLIRVSGENLVVRLSRDLVVDLRDFVTCTQAVLKLLQLLNELLSKNIKYSMYKHATFKQATELHKKFI